MALKTSKTITGLRPSNMANGAVYITIYDASQRIQLCLGWQDKVNIAAFANPKYSGEQMEQIRLELLNAR